MTRSSFYLQTAAGECLAVYRHAEGGRSRGPVLLLPPFGIDQVASHRPLHHWANRLAVGGRPVLRFDLPGTGDSAGAPSAAGRWPAWNTASSAAARWLRAETAARTVTAIGIGLGGLLAYELAAAGEIEQLVLWATPTTGRELVRELRAFGLLESSQIVHAGAPDPPPLPAGALAPGGYLLTPETLSAISTVDLGERPLPAQTRVLLLDRDGVAVDRRLVAALRRRGCDVTLAGGRGFAAMLDDPATARSPTAVFDRVASWLDAQPEQEQRTSPPVPPPSVSDRLRKARFEERPITVMGETGQLRGVLATPTETPAAPLVIVFLNAGAIRRIGPHRMWTDAARRWAARGVPCLRVDLEGIGDADGDGRELADVGRFHDRRFVVGARAVLDELERSGLSRRVVLVGLCSGAYWSFHTALEDERVTGTVLLNPRVLFWSARMGALRDVQSARLLLRSPSRRRILGGGVEARRIAAASAWAVAAPAGRIWAAARRQRIPMERKIVAAFDQLRDRGQHVSFVFSGGEPLHDELVQAGFLPEFRRWPNITSRVIPGRDHTLRPMWMHPFADAALDEAIARELARRET